MTRKARLTVEDINKAFDKADEEGFEDSIKYWEYVENTLNTRKDELQSFMTEKTPYEFWP